ncbi:MAG: hypothetical protein K6C10_10660 [Prevotella sp.]|nr:hypothetical protein [Prevotella sp.]
MKLILLILAAFLLQGCNSDRQSADPFILQGVWTLRQIDYPAGGSNKYADNEQTLLRLYDGDSLMHQCWLTKTETTLMIRPDMQSQVTLIEKGGGEYIYMEEDNPRPLTIVSDSVITIQQNGIIYKWQRANHIARDWSAEIREVISKDMKSDFTQTYALSAKERSQENIIHLFTFSSVAIIILMLLIMRIAYDNRKEKRRLQLQLQQIKEVQQERPHAVRQAIESVEKDFFASDDYEALQRRIAKGDCLKEDEWLEIESHIRKVYPGFGSQLRGLYAMSELEYQVCLLIKLRIAPSDIATVLARDVSTISTVRSRLYRKVFGQKGGAREWDEFLLSIGR